MKFLEARGYKFININYFEIEKNLNDVEAYLK